MSSLMMEISSSGAYKDKFPDRPESRCWTIRSKNWRDARQYPSNERILEIAQETLPAVGMEVINRNGPLNGIVVRFSIGTDRFIRQPFLDALLKESPLKESVQS